MVYYAKNFVVLLWIRILHNTFCMQKLKINYPPTINIVYNDTTRPREFNADLTTDGNTSTDASACVISENGIQGMWQVFLGYDNIIERIQITNMVGENMKRSKRLLAGFAVYVTPGRIIPSDSDKQYLCYQDTDKQLSDLFQNQTCVGYRGYLTIVNKRPPIGQLIPEKEYSKFIAFEICEVEIFGCQAGYYGQDCKNRCSSNCGSNQCFPSNGTCMDGCRQGYYGSKCSNKCNCKNLPCERVNGMCPSGGCTIGWQGDSCNIACSSGYYGDGCLNSCGKCAGDATCDHITGFCAGECLPGWRTYKCNEACQSGTYGEGCRFQCGNCADGTCSHIDGKCRGRCSAGYIGDRCNTVCPSGKYGSECSRSCGNCVAGRCNNVDGRCIFRCTAGYKGDKCNTACQSGKYGPGCRLSCGNCADRRSCDHIDGRCTGGCSAGYIGHKCQTACQSGKYGSGCSHSCGNCAVGRTCNNVDGRCPEECRAGYMGDKCDAACQSGKYGPGCRLTCGNCADGRTCDHVDGRCTGGCSAGYIGHKCQTACQSGKYGQRCTLLCGNCAVRRTCNHVDGRCPDGCRGGFMGDNCNAACSDGYYGDECGNECGKCAGNAACDHISGTCRDGCLPGWRTSICNKVCNSGYYGDGCLNNCGKCAGNATCDHITGVCIGGCLPGWRTEKCNKECAKGNYGYKCLYRCEHCKRKMCNHVNGECKSRCSEGWIGKKCDTICDTGKYGSGCKQKCGHCKNGKVCNHVNGNCTDGCAMGYRGDRCTEECTSGTYEAGCSKTCGHCKTGTVCHHVQGNCPSGCLAGWKGDKCDTKCEPGYYGNSCKQLCGKCIGSSCNYINGHCTCLPGWKSDRCDEKCIEGQYGTYCRESCGNCEEGSCDFVTGTCNNGCLDGWNGDKCIEKCLGTWFGKNCSKSCGKCTGEQGCHHINGSCPEGCLYGWQGDLCITRIEGAQNKRLYVIPVILCVVNLTAAFGIYFVIKRRKKTAVMRQNSITTSEEASSRGITTNAIQMSVLSSNADTRENKNVEYANQNPKWGMMVSELPRFIVCMSQEPLTGIVEEYQKLPKGPIWPHEEGTRSNNETRNRYVDILPYDHSRVILKGSQNYINASYIDSLEQSAAYIASQGPLKNTLGDFWRMIWQENVCKIVMLANCIEAGKAKVEQYWPEAGDSRTIGEFNISNQSETEYSAYIIKNIHVINNKNSTKRIVKHFHFTRWPDHGIPEIVQLIMFHKHVYTAPTTLDGPIVVHCSAGVGRTGTYIALDALARQGVKTGSVDVFGYVEAMRKQRMNMVQTVEQYRAIHDVVYEGCLFYGSKTSAEQFLTMNDAVIESDFQKLQSVRPRLNDDESSEASKTENCKKNKDMSILPSDMHRPYLNAENQSTDYINAVKLPSVTDQNGYLVTQWPMSHTAVDFWSLVYKYRSTTLVILDSDKDTASPDLVPSVESDVISVGPYSIQSAKIKVLRETIIRTELTVTKQENDNQHFLTAFRVNHWPISHTTPSSDSSLCDLCLEVMLEQQSLQQPGPVTVICSNGATKCGMYCTIANAIQSVVVDGFLDVPQIVRQLQLRRPAFIADLEQYMACINSIRTYCRDNCTQYANA